MSCCGGTQKPKQNQRPLINKPQKKKNIKICLIGSKYVGKTSIAVRYCTNDFQQEQKPTIAGAYQEKEITLKNGEQYSLNIWDTAGDEKFRSIVNIYYRDAQAVLLVYDVQDKQSFEDISSWIQELNDKCNIQDMILKLVANKIDVQKDQRLITTQAGKKFAQQNNLLYSECSAKTGEGVDQIFTELMEEFSKKQKTKN